MTRVTGTPSTLTYDQANRLTAYGGTAAYTYNGDGTRMSKTVSGTPTAFTSDGSGNLLIDGDTNYVYGPGGTLLCQITSAGVASYYHRDGLGDTRAITNGSGAVIATYDYDPYGRVLASTGSLTNPFKFGGGYTDTETGFIYKGGGYYDPATTQPLRVPVGGVGGASGGRPNKSLTFMAMIQQDKDFGRVSWKAFISDEYEFGNFGHGEVSISLDGVEVTWVPFEWSDDGGGRGAVKGSEECQVGVWEIDVTGYRRGHASGEPGHDYTAVSKCSHDGIGTGDDLNFGWKEVGGAALEAWADYQRAKRCEQRSPDKGRCQRQGRKGPFDPVTPPYEIR